MRRLAFGNFLVGVVSILLMTSQVRPCSSVAGMPVCSVSDVMHLLAASCPWAREHAHGPAGNVPAAAVEPSCWHADRGCHKAGCMTEASSRTPDWLELARAWHNCLKLVRACGALLELYAPSRSELAGATDIYMEHDA